MLNRDTLELVAAIGVGVLANVLIYIGAFGYANIWCIGFVMISLLTSTMLLLRIYDAWCEERADTSRRAHSSAHTED